MSSITITKEMREAMSALGLKNKTFRRGLWKASDLEGVSGAPEIPEGCVKFFHRGGCVVFWTDKTGNIHTNTKVKIDALTQSIIDLFMNARAGREIIPDDTLDAPSKSGGKAKYTDDFFND